MLPVKAILVDFDGTACTADVSEALLEAFGEPEWIGVNDAIERGEIGLRDGARRQAEMLGAPLYGMIEFAIGNCPLDPTFPAFVDWTRDHGLPLQIVSDGFGFYVRPILEAAGLAGLDVRTNELDGAKRFSYPNAHPECVGCGNCKMLAAERTRELYGPIAFVGEGMSDRYGALYSDLVFAKKELPPICDADGVPYLPWETFDDVRQALEGMEGVPGPVAPPRCPGWRTE